MDWCPRTKWKCKLFLRSWPMYGNMRKAQVEAKSKESFFHLIKTPDSANVWHQGCIAGMSASYWEAAIEQHRIHWQIDVFRLDLETGLKAGKKSIPSWRSRCMLYKEDRPQQHLLDIWQHFLSAIENVSKYPLLMFTLKHSQSPDSRHIVCVWLMQCPTLHGEITHHVNGNDFWEKGLDMSIADFKCYLQLVIYKYIRMNVVHLAQSNSPF